MLKYYIEKTISFCIFFIINYLDYTWEFFFLLYIDYLLIKKSIHNILFWMNQTKKKKKKKTQNDF